MILGIDPGFTGALCVISPRARVAEGPALSLYILDMPLAEPEILTSRDKNRSIEMNAIITWLKPFVPNLSLAVIERVHSAPKQGVASTFRFGEGYGQLQGLLTGIGVTRVLKTPPAVWKSKMGLTSNKQDSLDLACKLAPNYKHLFSRRKDDGRAEAFLLALFGARSLGLDFKDSFGGAKSNARDLF